MIWETNLTLQPDAKVRSYFQGNLNNNSRLRIGMASAKYEGEKVYNLKSQHDKSNSRWTWLL